MLYHTSICVADVSSAGEFYDRMLAPLGMRRIWNLEPQAIGYGRERGEFWIQAPDHQPFLTITHHAHFAFGCDSKAKVHEVFEAALAAGGRDVLAPVVQPEIGDDYFGAIVEDPHGHMIEIMKLRQPKA